MAEAERWANQEYDNQRFPQKKKKKRKSKKKQKLTKGGRYGGRRGRVPRGRVKARSRAL